MEEIWNYFVEHLDVYFPLIINLLVLFLGFLIGKLTKFREKNYRFYMQRYEELFNPFFLIVDKYNNRDGRKLFSEYTNEDVNEIFAILMKKWVYADTLMRAIIDKICILDNEIQKNHYESEIDKKKDIFELNESFELLYKIFLYEWNKVQDKLIWTKFQKIKNSLIQKRMIKKYKIEFEKSKKFNKVKM